MEHFVEGVLELLFSFVKTKPEKCPKLDHKDTFIIQYNKTASFIILLLLFAVGIVFLGLFFLMDGDEKYLFIFFSAMFFLLLCLSVFLFSIKCCVTSEKIRKTGLFLFEKVVLWQNVVCVRKIEKTDESSVLIALYNQEGKCVLDISSDMQNAWQIIKMAEEKNIEILEEKYLSLKQISRL